MVVVAEVRVRAEAQGDRPAVHALIARAFGTPAQAALVDVLRAQARPLVSLVVQERQVLVGHIMFTPVTLAGHNGLLMGLAPMAVTPPRQRAGIGSALVRAGLQRCRELGAGAVVVLGHPSYYPRFGFSPAARFGIGCEYDVPAEAFMAIELCPGALHGASGTVKYHTAFAGL